MAQRDTDFQHGSNDKRDPILKPSDIGAKGATITLLGRAVEAHSEFGPSLALPITLDGKKFTWFVRMDSKNYRELFRQFGAKVADWKGDVKVAKNNYLENDYIEVQGGKAGERLRAPVSVFED